MKYTRPAIKFFLILCLPVLLMSAQQCTPANGQSSSKQEKQTEGLHTAYFASGCFWCVEAIFESVQGVGEVISGYAGGKEKDPTYEQVSRGATGHAEAVEVYYDTSMIDYPTLLKVFFGSHDPTTLNRQGPDAGPQYRSAIFYENAQEHELIREYITMLEDESVFNGPITTEVSPLTTFWKAEDYHQDYEANNPNNPYVRAVSIPRLQKFQSNFPELLKEGAH